MLLVWGLASSAATGKGGCAVRVHEPNREGWSRRFSSADDTALMRKRTVKSR